MDIVEINESGLIFGGYRKGSIFEIEKHTNGFRRVEFVYRQSSKRLIFLEAKSSIPRERDDYFQEILEKFTYSLAYIFSGQCGYNQRSYELLRQNFDSPILQTEQDVSLILVISKLEHELLPEAQDQFRARLKPLRLAYGIKDHNILVFDKRLAEKYRLIKASATST